MVDETTMHKQVLVLRLISKYRTLGMFHADLDPLKRQEPQYIPDLDLRTYGFTDSRPRHASSTSARSRPGPRGCACATSIAALKDTYTRTFGAEYMYISDTATKRFVQERLEPIRSRPNYSADERRHILERLTAAETLERYLHTKYVGQKRFSGEGGDSMIPMLDLLIQRAGAAGVQEIVIGMAHRGRLNVLVNTLGQDAERPLLRIRRQGARRSCRRATSSTTRAFRRTSSTPGGPVHLTLAFNPSHLEIVDPVVEGCGARAPAPAQATRAATRCCRC